MPAAMIQEIRLGPPEGLGEPDTSMWAAVLADLTTSIDGSNASYRVAILRQYALAEMMQRKWSSKIKLRGPRDMKATAKINGELLHRLLNLINEACLLDQSLPRPVTLFHEILLEFEIEPNFHRNAEGTSTPETRRELKKQCQAENAALKALKNPFHGLHTCLLIDTAITMASNLDRFRNQHYTPFRKAREAATTHNHSPSMEVKSVNFAGEFEPLKRSRKKGKLKPNHSKGFSSLCRADP